MDALLADLHTSGRLTELLAFAELEPFGPLADDRRAGVVGAAVFNTAFGRGKHAKVILPGDLFPSLNESVKPQKAESMSRTLKAMTAQMGGVVKRKGEPVPAPKKPVPKKAKDKAAANRKK